MANHASNLLTLLLLVGLGMSSAALASGIERRVASAHTEGWHAAYTNESLHAQRILVRTTGDWSYQPRFACPATGRPWTDELSAKKESLVNPDCLPWSLLGRIQFEEKVTTFCAAKKDHFVLPIGGTVDFAINEYEGEYEDNSGALHIEVLALDITPETARPEIDDGLVMGVGE